MLKLTAGRWAKTLAALSLATFATTWTAGTTASAQITPGTAQQPPRAPSRIPQALPDEQPRGGSAARPATNSSVNNEVRQGVDPRVPGSGLMTSYAGLVTSVAGDRITVKMAPPAVAAHMEQVFQILPATAVMVNGDLATISQIRQGDIVRVITYEAQPDVAVKVTAVAPPTGTRPEVTDTTPRRPVPSVPTPSTPIGSPASTTPAARPSSGAVSDLGVRQIEPRNPNRPVGSTAGEDPTPNQLGVATEPDDLDRNFDVYPEITPVGPRPTHQRPDAPKEDTGLPAEAEADAVAIGLGIEVYDSPGDGVLVTDVMRNSPAALAGVEVGDFLMAMNEAAIADPSTLNQMLSNQNNAGTAELTIWRDGQSRDVTVHLTGANANQARNRQLNSLRPNLMSNRETSSNARLQVNMSDHERSGVIVNSVNNANNNTSADNTSADNTSADNPSGNSDNTQNGQLQPNDVILSVEGQPIDNRQDLMKELDRLGDDSKTVHLVVRRGGNYRELTVPIATVKPAAANGQPTGSGQN